MKHCDRVSLLVCLCALGLCTTGNAQEDLFEHYGCSACHRVNEKLVGPAFKDVAAKYRAKPDAASHLFDVVRNGSDEPIWGGAPMPPNAPEKVSDADLTRLVAFILGL